MRSATAEAAHHAADTVLDAPRARGSSARDALARSFTETGIVCADRGCFACMLGGKDRRTLFVAAAQWRGMEAAMNEGPG